MAPASRVGKPPKFCIGVAASAGGLEALGDFFSQFDPEVDAAFIVAQHLSPTHKSLLAPLVQRRTRLVVQELGSGPRSLRAGRIYITPANRDVVVEAGSVRTIAVSAPRGPKPSADRMLKSIAATWGKASGAVILSGTGSDGAAGVVAVDDAGGLVLAQDKDSAKYAGMPEAAVKTGCVTAICPPEALARMIEYRIDGVDLAELKPETGDASAFDAICTLVERSCDVALSLYKPATVKRRIAARMAAIKSAALKDYHATLAAEPAEVERLIDSLMISVTSFFRDRECFEALEPFLAERLRACHAEKRPFRAWIPACCTGEEAYSLVIVLDRLKRKLQIDPPLQIFATDLDEASVGLARRAVYEPHKVVDLDRDLLATYFDRQGLQFRLSKPYRQQVVFARHDILKSTPFLHLDFLSCRNLLIYLTSEAQENVAATFARALDLDGILFLGRSEGLPTQAEGFTQRDKSHHIFQKTSKIERAAAGPSRARAIGFLNEGGATRRAASAPSLQEQLEAQVLASMDPVFLVGSGDQVTNVLGDSRRLVQIQGGPFPADIYALVPQSIRADLRVSIARARKTGERQRSRCVSDGGPDQFGWVAEVAPLDHGEPNGHLVVRFVRTPLARMGPTQRGDDAEPRKSSSLENDLSRVVEELEAELKETRAHLGTVIQELETANEELQSINEELESANEELQSTNEEFETTNEELEASNEELETVNDELETRSNEILALNAFLNSIQNSVSEAIFLFDDGLQVEFCNRAASKLLSDMHLQDAPVRLSDLANTLKLRNWQRRKTQVLRSRRPIVFSSGVAERNFRSELLPQHDATGKPTNRLLLVVRDETELAEAHKRSEHDRRRLSELSIQQEAILNGAPSSIVLLDDKGCILAGNANWSAFARDNQGAEHAYLGSNYLDVCEAGAASSEEGAEQSARMAAGLRSVLSGTRRVFTLDYPCHAPDERRWYRAVVIGVTFGHRPGAVVSHTNVTDQVLSVEAKEAARMRALDLLEAKTRFLASMSHEIRTPLNAINGFSELMLATMPDGLPARFSEYLKDIWESSQHLIKIVGDIMEYSRLESQIVEIKPELTSVAGILEFCEHQIGPSIRQRGISIEIDRSKAPRTITCDGRLIRQALWNLLSNAVKHTPDNGRIDLSCRLDGMQVVFTVQDSGAGIAPEDIERIFQPFEQGRDAYVASGSGIGLGLPLVKRIAEGHGGRIDAVSSPGEGATFVLRVPLAPALPDAAESQLAEAGNY